MSVKTAAAALALLGTMTGAMPVFAAADPPARVDEAKGQVMVNRGQGFSPAVKDQPLSVGDRVLAGDGAKARLRYADGCKVNLAAGDLVTIADTSPCRGGVGVVRAQRRRPNTSGGLFNLPQFDATPQSLVAVTGSVILIGAVISGYSNPYKTPCSFDGTCPTPVSP